MSIKILITAFGPFQNIRVNPSQLLLEKLMVDLHGISGVEFTFNVLEVSYPAVDEFFNQISINYDWIINMGVASQDNRPRLETLARNQVNGKDIYGFEPISKTIVPSVKDLSTNFPKNIIDSTLNKFKEDIVISTDAGTYLCNYIYFKSLYKFQETGKIIFFHTADFVQRNDAVDLTQHAEIISSIIQKIQNCDLTA